MSTKKKKAYVDDDLLEDALKASLHDVSELLKKRKEELDAREGDLVRLQKNLELDPALGEPSDVLRLNVGGSRIDVLRRTLTSIEGSVLAARFSGRWDDSLEKDADGNYFIDQPIELFKPLVNYLRTCENVTPDGPPLESTFEGEDGIARRRDFMRMVEYYGLTLGVYPVAFELLQGDHRLVTMVNHPDFCIKADQFTTVKLAPLHGHKRKIKAFEVILGSFSRASVGWVDKDLKAQRIENNSDGVGGFQSSIAIDCGSPMIVCGGGSKTLPDVTIAKDTVLRCECNGPAWFVDGSMVATKHSAPTGFAAVNGEPFPSHCAFDVLQQYIRLNPSSLVPCISILGQCRVSRIELDFGI